MARKVSYNASGFQALAKAAEVIVEKVAEAVADDARAKAPVDTGRLRSSIRVDAEGTSATVSANTEYAIFVEDGTSRSSAQPFLKPALYTKRGGVSA